MTALQRLALAASSAALRRRVKANGDRATLLWMSHFSPRGSHSSFNWLPPVGKLIVIYLTYSVFSYFSPAEMTSVKGARLLFPVLRYFNHHKQQQWNCFFHLDPVLYARPQTRWRRIVSATPLSVPFNRARGSTSEHCLLGLLTFDAVMAKSTVVASPRLGNISLWVHSRAFWVGWMTLFSVLLHLS